MRALGQAIRSNPVTAFYAGILISSIGSMTFLISLVAFMMKGGFSLFQVGLVLGLPRIVPVAFNVFLGQVIDRLPPKRTVIVTEIGAALASVGIYFAWVQGTHGFIALLVLSIGKAGVLALQGGSRARMAKALSNSSYASNAKNAIWLNQATQGATLFSGVLGLLAVSYLSLGWVIFFDGITFIVNGALLLALPISDDSASEEPAPKPKLLPSLARKFSDLYRYNARAATLNVALAFVSLGSVSFVTRLAGPSQEWTPAYQIAYGLSVWIAAYLERLEAVRKTHGLVWVILACAYVGLGTCEAPGWSAWGLWLVRGVCFWILLHRISAHIQTDTPTQVMGSVSAARDAQMVTIMALGEVLVGYWQPYVTLSIEGAWRAGACLVVAAVVYLKTVKPLEPSYERAVL